MAICYLWKQNVRWIIDHHRVREKHALGNLMLHDFTYGFACNRKLQTNYTELPWNYPLHAGNIPYKSKIYMEGFQASTSSTPGGAAGAFSSDSGLLRYTIRSR